MNNQNNFWLPRLPNEIICKIFRLLSTKDLISVQKLGIERLILLSECCSFDWQDMVPPLEVSSFFSKSRVKYIRNINFNFLSTVTPSVLESSICKCTYLKSLSVICCGLTFANIAKIFSELVHIKDLAWDMPDKNYIDCSEIKFPSLKRVHLYITDKNVSMQNIVLFLNNCVGVQDLMLEQFTEVSVDTDDIPELSIFPQLRSIVMNKQSICVPILEDFNFIENADFNKIVKSWTDATYKVMRNISFNDLFNRCNFKRKESSKLEMNSSPMYLQLFCMEDIEFLHKMPNCFVDILGIIAPTLSSYNYESIQHVGGKKLKQFMVHSYPVNPNETCIKDKMTIDFFGNMFSTCCNISILDLASFHFHSNLEEFPGNVIKNLKHLCRLSLPSCAFQRVSGGKSNELAFKELVDSCTLVEHFSLCGCFEMFCAEEPTDKDISAIQNWSKLKHLILIRLRQVRLCSFLMPMAKLCPELVSLQLINVGRIVQYLTNVKCLLRDSKKLLFLRISHHSLYLNDTSLWNHIGMALKLQGLCLHSTISTYIASGLIVTSIKQLKYLNLFHLNAVKENAALVTKVKQCMKVNKIKNRRIEICFDEPESGKLYCLSPHFGIPFPNQLETF